MKFQDIAKSTHEKSVLNATQAWLVLARSPSQARDFVEWHLLDELGRGTDRAFMSRLERADAMDPALLTLAKNKSSQQRKGSSPKLGELALYWVEGVTWAEIYKSGAAGPISKTISHHASTLACEMLPQCWGDPQMYADEDELARWRSIQEARALDDQTPHGARARPKGL